MAGAAPIKLADFNAPEMLPEQRLCRSVIYQAYLDANKRMRPIPHHLNKMRKRQLEVEAQDRLAAIAWFRDAGPDFLYVCELADVDAGRVQANVLSMIGFPMRENANV